MKRVPLNFDWPIGEVWKGYVNPHYKDCPRCKGKGVTSAHERLTDLVGLIMLSGEDARREKCHPYFNNAPLYYTQNMHVGKDMIILTEGLAGREMSMMGHDSCDKWQAVNKIIKAAGLDPKKWGMCVECKGEGIDLSIKKAYETWEDYEPPDGDGFQLWETTSEGSPSSPVFETASALARWCEKNATIFGSEKCTKEQWLNMFQEEYGVDTGSMLIFKIP
jgi:hypothetical protein